MSESSIVVWQGFTHRWGYNHRHNMIGSFVEHTEQQAIVRHLGASGWGPDEAAVTDKVAVVRNAQGVTFQSGVHTIGIEAPETDLVDFSQHSVPLVLSDNLRNKDHYAVILNGFDLRSVGFYAHKIMTFNLAVGEHTISADGNLLALDILGGLRMDCRSFECYQDAVEAHYSSPDLEAAFREALVEDVIDQDEWRRARPSFRREDAPTPLAPDNVLEQIDEMQADERRMVDDNDFERGLREMLDEAKQEEAVSVDAMSAAPDRPKTFLQKLIDAIFAFLRALFSIDDKPTGDGPEVIKELSDFLRFYTRTKTIQRMGDLTKVPTFPADYQLDVHFIIAAWDRDAAQNLPAVSSSRSVAFDWGFDDEDQPQVVDISVPDSRQTYTATVPYIRGLSLDLQYRDATGDNQINSEAMHFTTWHTLLGDAAADSVPVQLLYRTQNNNMEKSQPPFSSFAHYFSGKGTVGATVGIIQLNADVKTVAEDRQIEWPGIFSDDDRAFEQSNATTPMTISLS